MKLLFFFLSGTELVQKEKSTKLNKPKKFFFHRLFLNLLLLCYIIKSMYNKIKFFILFHNFNVHFWRKKNIRFYYLKFKM